MLYNIQSKLFLSIGIFLLTLGTFSCETDSTNSCPTAGTECDDNNPTTINDRTDGECGCFGAPCPPQGEICDDGNPATENDIHNGSCECIGTVYPAQGTPCDDGDSTTENDIADGLCGCAGGACPTFGTSCDDDNSTTINDVADGQCGCGGIICPPAGNTCDDEDPSTENDITDGICGCVGTPCPTIGASCDDGDPTTINDIADGICGCEGVDAIEFLEDSLSTAIIAKRILIEKRTAINCPLCPGVTDDIDENEANRPGEISSIKYHFGFLASPRFGQPDYQTEVGDGIVLNLQSSSAQASVAFDRTPTSFGRILNFFSQSELNNFFDQTTDIYIDADATISSGQLSVSMDLLSQSGISESANNSAISQSVSDPNCSEYTHNTLFRQSVGDSNGILTGNVGEDTIVTFNVASSLNPQWVENNLKVVIFVTRGDGTVAQANTITPVVE